MNAVVFSTGLAAIRMVPPSRSKEPKVASLSLMDGGTGHETDSQLLNLSYLPGLQYLEPGTCGKPFEAPRQRARSKTSKRLFMSLPLYLKNTNAPICICCNQRES